MNNYISRRGVYYDLSKSPYEYKDKFGKVFKFSSQKKLDMFVLRVKELEKVYCNEANKLKAMGYIIDESYLSNLKKVPSNVYSKMLYK